MATFSTRSNGELLTAAFAVFVLGIVSTSLKKWFKTKRLYSFIPGPKPSSILGYLLDIHNPHNVDWHFNIPEQFGGVARLNGGVAGADALYITDPGALNAILIRQQAWFPESNEFAGLFGVIHCGDGVASVQGSEHRKQRKYMNPLFTASRVSKLTSHFYDVTRQMQTKLAEKLSGKQPGQVVNIFDYLTRATLEIVGTVGMGHTFNSFDNDSTAFSEFHGAITTVLPLGSQLFLLLPFLNSWRKMRPVWLRRTLASFGAFLWPTARKFQATIRAMRPVYVNIYNARKRVLEEGGSAALAETAAAGKDLITSMIEANWEADEAEKMSEDVVVANMGAIVHGGQETTSTTLARVLAIVAADDELQQKLRAEIRAAKESKAFGEELDFAEIERLPVLDAVMRETLRVYAPVIFLWRQTLKDVVVPLTYPIRSTITGEEVRELVIERGTAVYLGLAAANRATSIWGKDGGQFRYERWLNREATESKLPGAYGGMMTFLSGAKVCPGRTFAIMEMKLILCELLSKFSFEPLSAPIEWKMGISIEPRVRGREHEGAQVPLRVSLL